MPDPLDRPLTGLFPPSTLTDVRKNRAISSACKPSDLFRDTHPTLLSAKMTRVDHGETGPGPR